ncbi:MAG: helix-turn-helix transcriptional regulator [Bacteroidales bacterium]|nr:helix-turn-helix transcriptional regulator [Bacteroidales bacterium]
MTMTEAVAARIDDILRERKMSRWQLAEASNLPFGTIGNIFKGSSKSVTLSTLGTLCHGLGMSMSEFLDCEYFRGEKEAPKEEPVT